MEAEVKGIFALPPPPPPKAEEPIPEAEKEAAPEQANTGADAEMKEEAVPDLEEKKDWVGLWTPVRLALKVVEKT